MENNDEMLITNRRKPGLFGAAWGGVVSLALLACLAMPSYAASKPKPSKYSPDLAPYVGTTGNVTINVQFKSMPATGKFKTWQGSGASLRWKLPMITAATMTVPASMLPTLESEASVVYMSLDRKMTMTANPCD